MLPAKETFVMMHHMTNAHEAQLLAEKKRLEDMLAGVGHKTSIPGDWEATPEKMDTSRADVNEAADAMEEYETRIAATATLEDQMKGVEAALSRIKDGTYGVCSVCGNAIEEDRLTANPSALTCKAHLNS